MTELYGYYIVEYFYNISKPFFIVLNRLLLIWLKIKLKIFSVSTDIPLRIFLYEKLQDIRML